MPVRDFAKTNTDEQDKSQDLYFKIKAEFTKIEQAGGKPDPALFSRIKNIQEQIDKELDSGEIPKNLLECIDELIQVKIEPYKLGSTFSILNRDKYKAIRPGFIVIGGEASSGKTTLLTALGIDIIRENPDTVFIFYTLDDGAYLTAKRTISILTDIQHFFATRIHWEDLPGGADEEKAIREILKRVYLKEKLTTPLQIKNDAILTAIQTGCKRIIIGIDYLQLLTPPPGKVQREYYNEALKEIKEIQKELCNYITPDESEKIQDCSILLLSQLKRGGDAKGYSYRETSEIENQADICINMNYENTDSKEGPQRSIHLIKNKLGDRATLTTELIEGRRFTPFRESEKKPFVPPGKKTLSEIDRRKIADIENAGRQA